jgi:3-methyladenine DNA glycosylase Mpg
MARVPRTKERTATPAELADEAARCRRAREAQRAPAPAQEGNLVKCLVMMAAWRKCCCCNRPVLVVDARCRTDADVECPTCVGIREGLAKRLRFAKLASRVRFHLSALFSTGNDNGARA